MHLNSMQYFLACCLSEMTYRRSNNHPPCIEAYIFHSVSMDSESTSYNDLETKVNASMVEFYLQMANSARLQVSSGRGYI